MGYRHIVVSDTLVAKKHSLPDWFLKKWDKFINFDGDYWTSKTEYKRYGALEDFNTDVQKLCGCDLMDSVRLIYYADESDDDSPDIIFTVINKEAITEITPASWEDYTNY